MKITDVSKLDLDMAMTLQSVLKGAEIKISPADCGAIGKAIEWFAHFGKDLGLAWQMAKVGTPAPVVAAPTSDAPPASMNIKQFHPGVG